MAPLSSSDVFSPCGLALHAKRAYRRFERKAVRLSGTLFEATTFTPLASLTTTQLSLDGLAFVTQSANIPIGQAFTVFFRLEDDRQTVIQEDIVVKTIQADGTIGAAFADPSRYNFHLDFYLVPTSDFKQDLSYLPSRPPFFIAPFQV